MLANFREYLEKTQYLMNTLYLKRKIGDEVSETVSDIDDSRSV